MNSALIALTPQFSNSSLNDTTAGIFVSSQKVQSLNNW